MKIFNDFDRKLRERISVKKIDAIGEGKPQK